MRRLRKPRPLKDQIEAIRQESLRLDLTQAPEEYKGRVYEDIFERILFNLRLRNEITDWRRSEQHDEDDKNGVDFWITKGSLEIPFQVKSTSSERHKFIEKHANIPAINIIDAQTKEPRLDILLEKDTMKAINWYRKRR